MTTFYWENGVMISIEDLKKCAMRQMDPSKPEEEKIMDFYMTELLGTYLPLPSFFFIAWFFFFRTAPNFFTEVLFLENVFYLMSQRLQRFARRPGCSAAVAFDDGEEGGKEEGRKGDLVMHNFF